MKKPFFFIIAFVVLIALVVDVSLITRGRNQTRNTNSISPTVEEKIKQEIIDGYPNDQATLLYDGKNSIVITTTISSEIDVSAQVGHIYDIPKVIDILCPMVLEIVEKHNCTVNRITIDYHEELGKRDWLNSTIVNWNSNDGKTGFLFVSAVGMGEKDCTSEDVLKHLDSVDWEEVEKVVAKEKEAKQDKIKWFVLDRDTKTFHNTGCSKIKEDTNKISRCVLRSELIKDGYTSCVYCNS